MGPRWPPFSVSCAVDVGAHGLSPSQSKEVLQNPSCAAGLVGQGEHGQVFTLPGAAQCIEGTGQAAAGSVILPPLSELTAWMALGRCESLPDTSAWGVPPTAWRDVWSQHSSSCQCGQGKLRPGEKLSLVGSKAEFSPPPTQPSSPICGLGSGIRDHLHLSLLQHPMPRLVFWLLLPGTTKSESAVAECT